MKILAISGSLRKDSLNTNLLRNLSPFFSKGVAYTIFDRLEAIPPFNPDNDDLANPSSEIRFWREELRSADAIIIASPEYAHTITGVLKNAIDWVVGSGELVGKPIAAICVSPTHLGADKAHEVLKYTIRLLSAELLEEASFRFNNGNKRFDREGKVIDTDTLEKLKNLANLLEDRVRGGHNVL